MFTVKFKAWLFLFAPKKMDVSPDLTCNTCVRLDYP